MKTQLLLLPTLVFCASCSSFPGFGSGNDGAAGAKVNIPVATDPDSAPPALLDIPNFTALSGKVAGGGKISAAQVAQLPDLGYTTIINLQFEREDGVKEERAAAEAAGLNYVSIPCSGSNFTLEDGYRVAAALAESPGHTLLHCRSGGRVSAVWALARGIAEGLSPEEAAEVAANEGCRPIPRPMIDRVAAQLSSR